MPTEIEKKRGLSHVPRVGFAKDIDFADAREYLCGKLILNDKEKPIGVSWGQGYNIAWRESADKYNSKQLFFSDRLINDSDKRIVSIRHITNWGLTVTENNELILVHPLVIEEHTQDYYLNRKGIQSFNGPSFLFSDAIRATEKLIKQTSK